ncbi:flagellar protein FliS [Burkholderia sp. ABCPW 14]|uniref:Flagellar secretion chaperone FliS n=1 Tax=Burkholderia mayonis TaxID=1385591 RepID=A0A1B4FQQ5_9BURK|nr:flagellar protein FliS [Burkholderia mayonis]KVD84400.1 flagellar protein FliS [Burkholderia sp. ABCPW 14]KVE56940.1 flagellar protein FliS [Burkholderia mayonis]
MNVEHVGYRSYHAANLETQIASASPVQLVLVLTDGLLDEMARARAHIEGRRYEAKAASIDKCIDLLNGLSSSLDMEAGGEVVSKLAALYDYCARCLSQASVDLDVEPLDEAARLIGVLREGWQGARDGGR